MPKVSAKRMSCRLASGMSVFILSKQNWTCGLNVRLLDVVLKHLMCLFIYFPLEAV